MKIGACYSGNRECRFVVWAPLVEELILKIISQPEQNIAMKKSKDGYWEAVASNVAPDALYLYHSPAWGDKPDPASCSQPQGVHGPSQVIDHGRYKWKNKQWSGIKLKDMIMYELHVGTFTDEGTFAAAVTKLDYLCSLGINAVEVMPVAQFPGERNWGYDGAYPFAVQNSYGGVNQFKKFVDECHQRKLAVILDVVYNHLGPEGNYLSHFGPYFTNKYKTPWGTAVNFDDRFSDEVRNFFIQNALYWFERFHIDALRLDAVHAIHDHSAKPFLKELAERVQEFSLAGKRKRYLIAESDLNDATIIRPMAQGGFGLDAQWSDDFHHAVHTVLTKERFGYYRDFGEFEKIIKALKNTFVYDWEYSAYRKRHHGNSIGDLNSSQFVISLQNHDQIGNRMKGDRLSGLTSFEALKLAAGLMMVSPYIPLLFMGEEYGEKNPFLYFVSHGDQNLIHAVREGRREEFKAFCWQGEPCDPQDADTFFKTKLNWEQLTRGNHAILFKFYQTLIQMRRKSPALKDPDKSRMEIIHNNNGKLVFLRRWHKNQQVMSIINFNEKKQSCPVNIPLGTWKKIIDSTETQWGGSGRVLPLTMKARQTLTIEPLSFAAYQWGRKI